MLAFALLVSSAVAMEIGLNMTGSGTAQSQLSTAASSALETISEVIITLSQVSSSSASSTKSSSLVASPTVTDGPIYTNFCNSYEGRNCDRLPEQPFWSGILPGENPYGFTPTAQQNPFSYYLSFTESGQPSTLLETQSLCSIAWYTNYTSWLASAPLTYSAFSGGLVPASTATSTLEDLTATDVSYGSTTGTATVTVTYTDTYSGVASTETDTEVSYLNSDYTYTTTQTATTETLVYTAYSAYYYPSYAWSAQAPCCSACTIYAGEIEVMYFPRATAASGNLSSTQPATVTNSAGFVFTSPSVYMALQTLAASNLCGPVGSSITKATTLSFAPSELSTVPAYSQDGTLYTFYPYWSPTAYEPATFGTAPCTDETTVTAVDEITATVTYNPCYPYISIPAQVQTADPLWSTCTSRWEFLLYDPPYVISAAQGLGAFSSSSATTTSVDPTTSPQLETTSPSVASTGPTPSAPTVAPTNTATLDPTTATSAPVQPASTQSSTPSDPATSSSPGAVDPGTGQSTSVAVDPGTGTSTSPGAVDPGTGESTSPAAVNPGTGESTSPVAVNPGTGESTSPAAVNPGTGASTSPGAIEASSTAGGVATTPTTTAPAIVTIGSSTITANSASGFVIGSTTLTPGGQITVGGTTVSLASNGETIAIGSSTQALVTTPSPTYVIGSQTLSAGGAPITVSGTTYSLESGGSSVVVGGTTQPISALLGSSTPEYVVASGSQTLKAGASAITVSGTAVSLQSDGSSVVLGGSTTEALSAFLGSTTTSGLAGIIATIGGFGTSTTGSSTSSTGVSTFNGTAFTGSAVKRDVGSVWIWGTMLVAGMVVVGWL